MKLLTAALLATALSLPLAAGAVYAATPADALVIAQNIDDIVALDPDRINTAPIAAAPSTLGIAKTTHPSNP